MKILIATSIYPPEIGRPSDYVRELPKYLSLKHTVNIVAYTNSQKPVPGATLISVSKKSSRIYRLLKYFLAMLKASRDTEVIYVQNAMAAGLPVILIGFLRKMPVIINFFGDEGKNALMFLIQKFVLQRAAIIIAQSKQIKNHLINTYKINQKKIALLYLPAENADILPFDVKREPFKILVCANKIEEKQAENISKIFTKIKEKYPQATMVVIEEVNHTDKIKTEYDNLKFLGKVSKAEMWWLLQNSEVVLIYSLMENKPYTALKSFMAETALICINTCSACEIVENEKTGLVVKNENHSSVAEAVIKIFGDETLKNYLTTESKKFLKEEFSWEKHVQSLHAIFESIVSPS